MAATTTDSKELVRRVIDAFNDNDFDAMAEIHSSDVVLHQNGEDLHGYDAIEEAMGEFLAESDAEFTLEDLIGEGDTVAGRYTITATQAGQDVEVSTLCLVRVADGEIVEVWVHSNESQ